MDENMISTEGTTTVTADPIRTISFGDYEGLVVDHAYPYRYESGKGRKVFRIRGSEEVFTHEVRDALKSNTGTIYYYENGELKGSNEGYSYDYMERYHAGTYEIEIECLGDLEERLLIAERQNQELAVQLTWARTEAERKNRELEDRIEQAEAEAYYANMMLEEPTEVA